MNGNAYLSFTRRERFGILSLILILVIIAVLPHFIPKAKPVAENISPAQLEKTKVNMDSSGYKKYYPEPHYHRYPENNRKYYQNDYYRKRPGEIDRGNNQHKIYKSFSTGYAAYHKPRRPVAAIDINTADTAAFIALPGIGSKLAARIVLFREKLGGFYSVDQVREVYGLQDSVFSMIVPFFKCDSAYVRKLDINNTDKETLKNHPYIRWNAANALVAYRTQHGNFRSLDELEKISNIDPETLHRFMPYLSITH